MKRYQELLNKGKISYETKLWNGKYYKYDEQIDTIMADMLAGQWYARACGLDPIVSPEKAVSALKTIYEYNVLGFKEGTRGAINGMRPDKTVDYSCLQSAEVWTGTTVNIFFFSF